MLKLRKQNSNNTTNSLQKQILLKQYVWELKRQGYSFKQIGDKLRERNYPDDEINYLLQLNYRRLKMVKKQKKEDLDDEEEFDEDLDEDDEEEGDEDDEEEIKPTKVKSKHKLQSTKKDTAKQVSIGEILQNFEQRISNLESSLYRLRSI